MQNDKTVNDALKKKAAYGPDVDIDDFKVGTYTPEKIAELNKASEDMKERMVNVGVAPAEEERSGSLLFIDNGPSHISTTAEGLELMS
ncbi:MAG: SufD family Fe-S cluster assembly protein, partial [Methanomassiliicoccaceae archaeon]|nr:SufD family Fe-S cluster assembly protein [Methanomassiliicoccaceae archaeon]